jgi:hypothetical protein
MPEIHPVAEQLVSAIMTELFDENGRATFANPEVVGPFCHICAVMCIEP